MPYTNIPEELWSKMDDCVDEVTAQGHDKESAIAICHTSIMGEKSLNDAIHEFYLPGTKAVRKSEKDGEHPASHYLVIEDPQSPSSWHLRVRDVDGELDHRLMGAAWAALHGGYRGNKYEGPNKEAAVAKLRKLYAIEEMEPPAEKAVKVGARHSHSDREALQLIHDGAVQLGADCPPTPEIEEIPILEPEKSLVFFGGEVKALGDGKLGGYLVRFTNANEPDLTGDYFDQLTDFGGFDRADVYYQHGMDTKLGRRRLGKGELRIDDLGVWIEAQLALRDEYEKAIYTLAEQGKMGWSSGTASHLVGREPMGKAQHITAWPLGLDASLTPTPAEPRNIAMPMKSYLETTDMLQLETTDRSGAEETSDASPSRAEEAEPVSPIVSDGLKSDNLETPTGETEEVAMEITQELQELIDSAARKAADEAIKALPAVNPAGVVVVTDEADQPWPTPGEFFKAVKDAAFHPRDEDPRLRPLKATGLSEGVPADGGYLLAPTIAAGIIERVYSVGQVLSRVAVDNIGPNSNSMVYNMIDESSRAIGSAYGGVRGYWIAEAGTKTASDPTFRQVELKLKKIAALAYATDELLADATALESWLTRTVPEVLRFQVEDAIVNGDGVGKPLGIMASPCLIQPLRIGANLIDKDDIANLWKRRWTGMSDYVWLISPSIFGQLINLVVGNFPVLMPANNVYGAAAATPFPTIYGRPVLESEYCAQLGTTGDIILASLGQYQTIQKGGVQSASSIHVAFTTDETAFRFVYRIDGRPLWNSALTPLHATDTVSPFVALATASA